VEAALRRVEAAAQQRPAGRNWSGAAHTAVQLCSAMMLNGDFGAEVGHLALEALAKVALGEQADVDLLASIVGACELALVRRADVPVWAVLATVSAIGQSPAADAGMLERLIELIANHIAQSLEEENAVDLMTNATTALASFSHRVAVRSSVGEDASLAVVRTMRRVIEATAACSRSHVLRLIAMNVLATIALPMPRSVRLVEEVLSVLEMLAASQDMQPSISAAFMLDSISHRATEADFGRILRVLDCVPLQAAVGTLRTLQTRVLAPTFRGPAEVRVGILAQTVTMQEERRAVTPCGAVVRFLRDLHPPASPLREFLHISGSEVQLAPDVVLLIDDLVPPSPGEAARAAIVDVCARTAELGNLEAVVDAVCLQPLRVGRRAARAFAMIVNATDADLVGDLVNASHLLAVGDCLRSNSELEADGDFAHVAGLAVARLASEFLAPAVTVTRTWSEERRASALSSLCALAGHLHDACRRLLSTA